jgi:hypothetical protein
MHAELQEEGCCAFYYISIFDVKSGDMIAEGVDIIVDAMTRHQHAGVQEEGCAALCNLASNIELNRLLPLKLGLWQFFLP